MRLVWRPDVRAFADMIPDYVRLPLSYVEVGATARDELPAGYHHLARSIVLGTGAATLDRAEDALLSWAMHRRAGLVVAAPTARAARDVTTVMAFGLSFVGAVIPCRVVRIVDEPDRRGFAYGTLPGHPERGEEAFMVERVDDRVTFSIRAFSAPGSRLVEAAGPIARHLQARTTERYLRALAKLSRG